MEKYSSESTRVYLRPMIDDDITDEYLSWFSNEEVTKFLESRNLTKTDVRNYLIQGKETGTYFMYAICDSQTEKHIGNVKIGPIDRKNNISDLVTVIGDTEYWGKGLATEAIKLGSKLAFEKYDIRKLTGGMYSDNIGSIKCYTKAGWQVEASLKGHYLKEEIPLDRVCVSFFNPKYFN